MKPIWPFKSRAAEPKDEQVQMGTAPPTRIKLLANVIEDGGVKLTRRRKQADGTYSTDIAWAKGSEIDVSQPTGQKYVDRGQAEWVRS